MANDLIELARKSISAVFEHCDVSVDEIAHKYGGLQGVFVTLTIHGELRGCIGFAEPIFPLYEGVIKASQAAAFEDPRFPRLQKEELKDVRIEISVLSKPELIRVKKPEDYLKQIKIGKDGLIIRGKMGSGLLLPQVFAKYNCTAEQALEMVCQKAWLQTDAWKDLDNKVFKFQARIIKEGEAAEH
ncbi:MAG: AmmeMemoRadiSam system protein A [Candidatus Woesearchaeota archaeon]